MAESNKIPKIMKKIGTHSGVFHCDEALACFMLKLLPEFRDSEIVRTRNQEVGGFWWFGWGLSVVLDFRWL